MARKFGLGLEIAEYCTAWNMDDKISEVLEEEPGMFLDIVTAVDHPNLRQCLDIGHVNTYAKAPVMQWLESWKDYLSHFHIHNNDGSWDTHSPLDCGNIPMGEFLERASLLSHGVSQ